MTAVDAIDDHALLRAYATARDPEAFAELARRYAGLVLSVAQRITRSPHDAEDITQTCFLELAKNAPTVTSIPGYLHRAATTRSLNLLRDNKTRRTHESRSLLQTPDLTWQKLLPLVDSAIDQLPDDLRFPLILHFQQNKSQSDIAGELHLSQPTVSRRLDSAIAELRKNLAKMGEGAGVLVGGINAAVTTVALRQTAAPTPPTSLLSALNRIGLSGVGHHAATATAASATKILALLLTTSAFALLLFFLFPRHAAPPPTPTPPPQPYVSPVASSMPLSPSPALALPTPSSQPRLTVPRAIPPPTFTALTSWQSTYPFAVAALSPDGSLLACASSPRIEPGNDTLTAFSLYLTVTHDRLHSFPGHSRLITALAFSPDGTLLASASRDGTLRIWDPLTADELHRFEIKNVWFTALAFTPDSRHLLAATASDMDTHPSAAVVSLYDYNLATEKSATPFPSFASTLITALAISPDTKQIAIAYDNADIAIYDRATARQLFRLDKTAATTALAFPTNDHLLAANTSLTLWNLDTRAAIATFPTPAPISSLSLSNHTLLTTSPDATLTLWSLSIPR